METSVVHSIAQLAAATAEDALTVSGLPPPPSSTSLNVSPNHRYTLTTHSNAGDSPAATIAQLAVKSDGKASTSSPGLGTFKGRVKRGGQIISFIFQINKYSIF